MIYYTISSKTNHWPRRVKKIDTAIGKILIHKKDLKFVNSINYFCNFILANDLFIKSFNKKFNNIPGRILWMEKTRKSLYIGLITSKLLKFVDYHCVFFLLSCSDNQYALRNGTQIRVVDHTRLFIEGR